MIESNQKYSLYKEQICNSSELFLPKASNAVYEVIRFIEGVPLFFDEHYQRLTRSVDLTGRHAVINKSALLMNLVKLAHINRVTVGNVMLKLFFQGNDFDLYAYFIPHIYPVEDAYVNGIEVAFLNAERINPEAKVEQNDIRSNANQLIKTTGVYDVLLVDHHGYITEGSRTNFFAISNNTLYCAPLDKVLKGITLMKTIELAKQFSIPIEYLSIPVKSIHDFDSAFLTGTSPKILPICKLDQHEFDVQNELLKKLMQDYQQLIEKEIEKQKGLLSKPLQ